MRLLPDSLFSRAAAILLGVFLVAQGAAMYAVWKTVVTPLAERSADDLAARMVLAAQTWVELPPETRADYEIELFLKHNLELGKVDRALPSALPTGYFGDHLAASLSRRTGQAIRLKQGPDPAWAWAEITLAGNMLRVGYLRDNYELDAPWEAGAVFLAGALLTLAAALFLVRRTAHRLRLLARSAAEVGQGRLPERLPETGAAELRDLTAAFNRMADEVQGLLENRTVLLSGISHDLRTPITRMQLALAMLDEADADMVKRMEGDLREMTRLIAQMLDFARSLKGEGEADVELGQALAEMAASCSHPERVGLGSMPECPRRLSLAALNRVVGNLLENALRYGDGRPVDLELACAAAEVRIRVLDRGPGIPEAERDKVFQPFYRLEESRSRDTGGSGLGLAIVRQLADAQGWRVELADRPGGGLAAEVVLPRTA
ncbi:MAG: HAMP domain-containing protein [Thiobacillus sp.]|nr:HAMP domain-containing protein [Thiobacillus sp.]